VLAAHPGESQGRPKTTSSSQLIVSTGLPSHAPPESPGTRDAQPRLRPGRRSRGGISYPDNAVCESFHATLEKELLRRHSFRTRQEAKTAIFDWIEGWYNRERRHSRLGYRSPADYEHQYDERGDCADGTDEKTFIEERARAA
jgi:transposase InsO family protein